jgi:uncharacterized protein involved in outer membrane biogenesis
MVKKLTGIYEKKIRPHAKKILIGLLIFFVVFTITGFFILPPVLKSILTKELSQNLHRGVTIGQIKINPCTLSVTVRGLLIKDRSSAETFVSCDELFLNLGSLSAIRMAPVLKEIRITKPYVKIIRNKDLSYNFSDLLEKKEPTPPEKTSKPLRFSLNNIRIINGSVDFVDMPEETKHTVRDLKIGVPFLSNIPSQVQTFVQPHFSAKINDALYTIDGKTKPFTDSLETSFDINIKDLNIPYYLAYVPMKMNFKVVSASLDTEARVSFIETKDKKPSLTITGNVSLKNIAVNDQKDKPVFRLPLLNVSIAPSEPLSKIIHVSKVLLQSPEVEVHRDEKGVINVQSLLPEEGEAKPAAKKTEDAVPLSLDIDEIQLAGGKISFSDLSGSKPFKTMLDPIDLKIDHFSNSKDKKSAYALSLSTEAKEAVKVEGEFSVDPLGSEGMFEVASVLLKKYSPYYRDNILFDIEDGRLDLSTRYRYATGGKEPEINLSGLSVALKALRLRKAGENEDFVKVPNFTIKETDVDLTKRELTIGNLSTEKGEILVKRSSNGDLNLLTLTPPATPPAPASASKEPPKKLKAGEKPAEPEKPWLISLKQMLVDKYTVRVEDQTTPEPVTLVAQNLSIKGENISTAKNSKGRLGLSLRLNGKGTISTTGTIGIEPLSADLKIGLKGLEIAPFQPYFTDNVKLTVTGGAISTNGNVSFTSTKEKGIKATYKGGASVANFSSIDKLSGADLLKLESLSLNDLNVAYAPLSVGIKGVSLTNFYALVLVNPDGKINLQEVMAAEEPKAETTPGPTAEKTPSPARQEIAVAPPEEKEPSKNIRIDQVTLQGGRIDFVDKSVKPEFSTRLSEMGGRVSGLSAEQNTTADVELRGKLNDYAPLEITGKINPLTNDLFVDLKARIKDLDLSPATPYSGKYAGYSIEKGKLSVDVKYSISKGKLDSQNNIFIDQFTFGEKVESPQATSLPVRLAVALLKDRKGEIKLDLPVTGSLNDPKFSVWGIIVHILVNLIAKAATSPFALLGAVFGGGGEELSYIEFDYGNTVITEPNMKKLDTVSKALQDRPALKLDIEGHVDMENDREGLKQLLFNRKIKAQKLNEMVKKGQPAVPVDEVKIEPTEYEKYLKMAYKAEKFPKPKNFIGMAKDIPVPEMEKLMLTHTEVKEGDLRALASQRAMKVEDVILKSGKVEPERVFILEPKSLAPEKKEKMKASRVDFKLK